jgi:cytochrome c
VASAVALALLSAACGGAAGATPAQMTEAKGQSSTGALLYERSCESCHGENGAGTKRGPAVLGAATLARSRFKTAEDLFDYVAREMPKDSPGSLDFTQYWNIVTFMAATTGQKIPDDRLSESNAAQVRFSD